MQSLLSAAVVIGALRFIIFLQSACTNLVETIAQAKICIGYPVGSHQNPSWDPFGIKNGDPSKFKLGPHCILTGTPVGIQWDPSWNTMGHQSDLTGI